MSFSLALAAAIALSSGAGSQDREPVAAPPTGSHVDVAVEHLEAAAAALSAWRRAVDAGAALDPAGMRRVEAVMRTLGKDLRVLDRRHRANLELQRAASAPVSADALADRDLENRARALCEAWIREARALGEGSAQRRSQALEEVRAALGTADAVRNLAALRTLQRIGDVEYDKASFRPLVLPLARDARGPTLPAALYALSSTERRDGDEALVHAGWERDPEALRDSVIHLMRVFSRGELKGRSEEITLEVLADTHRNYRRGMNGMWGARVGPALEARMIELARSADHEERHDAIYFGLSTFQDKSAAVVDTLIEVLQDPDPNNSGRALWGLGHGVPEAQRARVVEAVIELYSARSDASTRGRCEHIVRVYGGEQALARLPR